MLKSLRSRNIALLIIVVVVGQILSFALIWLLAIRPQAERLGQIMARNIAAISMAMDDLPADKRQKLVAKINAGGAIRILPGNVTPPEDRGVPTLLESLFVKQFAKEMQQSDTVIWRGATAGQLWVYVRLGGEYYWLSYERPKGWTPNGSLLASFLIAVTLAIIGGILLQRRLAQPLAQLSLAADKIRTDSLPVALPVNGPEEIAAVAKSFNHMGERIAAQDAERAFMLAGLSHDLRTPMTKVRLAIATIPDIEAETDALLNRQFEQIDQMLGQFLDFARGDEAEPLVETNISEMIASIASMLQVPVQITGIAGGAISTRPAALNRAISNLIRNAAQYGQPPISASIKTTGAETHVTIVDHGDGVPEELLTQLGTPFVRGSKERVSDGGTGLGLAIARHVAKILGGRLELQNLEGGGFSAALVLPLNRPEEQK
jgi:two-component system, OmpR family, osmolarity sensor histidine kinase EnvZ